MLDARHIKTLFTSRDVTVLKKAKHSNCMAPCFVRYVGGVYCEGILTL